MFAQTGGIFFGWFRPKSKGDAVYVVYKYSMKPGRRIVASWPLSSEGWADAWRHLDSDFQQLADRVAAEADMVLNQDARRQEQDARHRELTALEEAARADLLAEEPFETVRGLLLLGGFGLGDSVRPGARLDVTFTPRHVWYWLQGEPEPALRQSYTNLHALRITGGVFRSGGGYGGGGFGVIGIAEGMAMAALLNKATKKSSTETTVRLEGSDADVFLFTSAATPRQLEMRLARANALIRVATTSKPAELPEPQGDLVERLERLGELLSKGLLTESEFAAAKAQLLEP